LQGMRSAMKRTPLSRLVVGIKGAGEMASGIAWRLYKARLSRNFMMEVPRPLAVRREVSFCDALYDGVKAVEEVVGVRADEVDAVRAAWEASRIAVATDPEWRLLAELRPDVVVDAILAKRNLGTHLGEAPLVVALGPGFQAGADAHLVIETNRGHDLGRILASGNAEPDTGVPGEIGGHSVERVLRAPVEGTFQGGRDIGDAVSRSEVVGSVGGVDVTAGVGGVIRGLIRSGTPVQAGLKIGDIDPRGDRRYCHTISDKARAIAGSVLEAILRVYNV
jgi:xanthine dehydrogenase accessory factor